MAKNLKAAKRREVLAAHIKTGWAGNVSAFARDAGKPQSQIADMLDGRKAFGEKVARELEANPKVRLAPGELDGGAVHAGHVAEPTILAYGASISPEAADVGREWEKLHEPYRKQIAELIYMLVAAQFRESRPAPKSKKQPKRHEDRPRPT